MSQVLEEHPEVSVRSLCELFGVSRSWYYDKPSAEQKVQRDVELRDAIERIVLEFPGYGYRRVTQQLHREECGVNHKRVLRVMREESLLCQLRKHFVALTDSFHSHRTYPNLLGGSCSTGWMRRECPTSRTSACPQASCTWRLSSMRIPGSASAGRCPGS